MGSIMNYLVACMFVGVLVPRVVSRPVRRDAAVQEKFVWYLHGTQIGVLQDFSLLQTRTCAPRSVHKIAFEGSQRDDVLLRVFAPSDDVQKVGFIILSRTATLCDSFRSIELQYVEVATFGAPVVETRFPISSYQHGQYICPAVVYGGYGAGTIADILDCILLDRTAVTASSPNSGATLSFTGSRPDSTLTVSTDATAASPSDWLSTEAANRSSKRPERIALPVVAALLCVFGLVTLLCVARNRRRGEQPLPAISTNQQAKRHASAGNRVTGPACAENASDSAPSKNPPNS